jgi:methyltransferase (TIGR00027 family)
VAIAHISDTARWVAYYRAMESERPDAIFRDPFARRLAGVKGEEIVGALKQGRRMAWAMIVRTAVFDEIIMARIRAGADLVVNLAAGLDARAWRLPLPPALRWIDVDLPDILAYKAESLRGETPGCRYEAVSADLTDAEARGALLARLGPEGRNALIVTEGLLVYLTSDQVGVLARELHAVASARWWLIDLASPRLLALMNRMWGRTVRAGNAEFRFAPAEGTGFFRRFGWRETEFRPAIVEAKRLNREMRFMWLWRLMMLFSSQRRRREMLRMSGVVLMERE